MSGTVYLKDIFLLWWFKRLISAVKGVLWISH